MHRKGSSNGSRRDSNTGCPGNSGLPTFRGTDGPSEKVAKDISDLLPGIRVNLKTSELHPDDQIKVVDGLSERGHTASIRRNNVFVDTQFRVTLDGPHVYVTDLRTFN